MTNELEPQGENNLVELTPDQIQALDIPSRPGYLGEDDEGPYKVDIYGRRRRPFQKGGPSPNYKGRGAKTKVELANPSDIVDNVMKDIGIEDPLTTLMKIVHKDRATLRALKMPEKSVSPNMQKSILENICKILYKPKTSAEIKAGLAANGQSEDSDESNGIEAEGIEVAFLDLPNNNR